ncbi:hypothetical protein A1O3_05895 [Capronia epimyces CBS 606.96]|uniref:Uncharacterized protein n=1 Tax=Capronia epimyces CBS 606.96 TaxID=1182542 RepID=W9Y6F9_9EURO|nr:uncharacterized protein A1O3_05895 [Capronia epimyces CBS 606.96]EXJ85220.1 hypothetical protein A1O3_05895 [Capronia epimyces CBS 606.96]
MAPVIDNVVRRSFDPGAPSDAFRSQWKHPGDIFTLLLIIGGDVVARALAQLAGSPITPVAFSFGWVAYAAAAVVSAVGENKLMPLPDCDCQVINGKSGYVRSNTSWVIGRIVRDFESWMDRSDPSGRVRAQVDKMLRDRWEYDKAQAEKAEPGAGARVEKPVQAGLCVSIYQPGQATKGYPGYDLVYWMGFATAILQLGIAAIPCGLFGDWGILLITIAGILLSFATGSLPQWRAEKWACRQNSTKSVILTKGNGSQHAIVIVGNGKGLDLEDLAAGQTNVNFSASWDTRAWTLILATLWILLLITAGGLSRNTWFLLAIGGIGILQNVFVAGFRRFPEAYGIPLTLENVIGSPKVMETLYAVEEQYPRIGASMRATFFPGDLRPDEEEKWQRFADKAKAQKNRREQTRENHNDNALAGASRKVADDDKGGNKTTVTIKAGDKTADSNSGDDSNQRAGA